MVDPVVHAKMTMLIQQEKKLKAEMETLDTEIPTWEKRVDLARQKGMIDLAKQARARADELRARVVAIEHELEVIQMDKDMLRYQAKRPSGVELQRAEALLDQIRLGGLVDPDRNEQTPGDDVTFDFKDED
ncbi:MAG: hypothetical protein R3E66_00945 [bacterium]